MKPSSFSGPWGTRVLKFHATEGLGSSVSQVLHLDARVSPEKLWPLCLGFCLSLTVVALGHLVCFNRALHSSAPR